MEIEFFGANSFRIKTKKAAVVVDDNLNKVGSKSIVDDKTTLFYTNQNLIDESAKNSSKLMVDSPGEFEVGDITATGKQARAHMDKEDEMTATVFKFMANGQTVTVLGHVHPNLSNDVEEFISGTDVLLIPVGGNGYTLDPIGATKIIKKAEPEIVIPSQYEIKGFSYEVPAQSLEELEKLPTTTLEEAQDSLKLGDSKSEEASATQTRVVVLNAIKK